jgi:DDE family transposase
MNDDLIVTAYVVIDETMAALGHRSHRLAQVSDAEVLTVAVVAAKYFANNHERALGVLHGMRYLTKPLSTSRFNRRLHALGTWLGLILETLGELFAEGEAFLLDSMPIPACRRARARRSRKLRGKAFCGYCAAKKEKFRGTRLRVGRLHLICTTGGVPVAFDLVPGGLHDLTPIHELTYGLPVGAAVYGDKADNAGDDEATIVADTGVRLVPLHKANMRPNDWADKLALRAYRKRIETLFSQLTTMGVQQLHARTNLGLELKLHAALLAAVVTNGD